MEQPSSVRGFWVVAVRYVALAAMLALDACSPSATAPKATATTLQAAATAPPATEPATRAAVAGEGPAGAVLLAELGPYIVGVREFLTLDPSRDDREVGVRVWYPAVLPEGETGKRTNPLADPDRSSAPYPLIVSSAKLGSIFAPYVVTHGFVWAGVTGIDTYLPWNEELIDQPLDILFALGQVASNPPEELVGIIDAEHAGAIGYSFDGYNTLAMSGARVDPEFYKAQCAGTDATAEAVLSVSPIRYQCAPARVWEGFVARAGEVATAGSDGLWRPMTDARIRAVMPMAAEGWLLFGDRGLAAVDRPVLMIAATQDELYPENALIFEHLGTPDKALISFLGLDHMMVYDPDAVARMAFFASAFFGYHLQGHQDYGEYFSEAFVSQQDGLAWGVYEGK